MLFGFPAFLVPRHDFLFVNPASSKSFRANVGTDRRSRNAAAPNADTQGTGDDTQGTGLSGDNLPISEQLRSSRKQCRKIATSHYENFLVASVLLPRSMRQPFYDVYAFCRTADDIADESDSKEAATRGLADYRKQIAEIYSAAPTTTNFSDHQGLFTALADTIARFDLPRDPFDALLDAFEQDQVTDRYDNQEQLLKYCQRSANPVGRLVLAMADCRDERSLKLSDQICTALQLTNFWQDIARDFKMGRIYLPKSVMNEHGFGEELIQQSIHDGTPTPLEIRQAVSELCDQARQRFKQGRELTQRVPSWLAADVELFVRGGLATLDAIERAGFDVLQRRVKIGKTRQAWMTIKVVLASRFPKLQLGQGITQ